MNGNSNILKLSAFQSDSVNSHKLCIQLLLIILRWTFVFCYSIKHIILYVILWLLSGQFDSVFKVVLVASSLTAQSNDVGVYRKTLRPISSFSGATEARLDFDSLGISEHVYAVIKC